MSGTVVLIPARGGSKRIPRKNLADLCGKPLIAWTIEAALEADVGPVYVSTDDDEIADVALRWGANVQERIPTAANDRATAEDVLDDFTRMNGAARILYVEPTWPLRTAHMLRMFHDDAEEHRHAFAVEQSSRRLAHRGRMIPDPLLGCGMFCLGWSGRNDYDRSTLSDLWWRHVIIDGPPGWNIDVNYPWDLAAARDAMERRLRGTT